MSGRSRSTEEDFNLGLTVSNNTQAGRVGSVFAAGKDDHGQVSGMNSLEPDSYIIVSAGSTRSAALTHDGTIVTKGEPWTGTQPPAGPDYTDIMLGPDWGFAIKESAQELTVTGPLSPGKPVECVERDRIGADNLTIPYGSTIEHTDNDVTRIIRPDGSMVGWANDREADVMPVPNAQLMTATRVYIVPSGSMINSMSQENLVIKNFTTNNTILTILNQDLKVPSGNLGNRYQKTPVIVDTPNNIWVEWANMTFNSNAPDSNKKGMSKYIVEWTVPSEPSTPVTDVEEAAWMGIEPGPHSDHSKDSVFQNVLMYEWPDFDSHQFPSKWSAAVWHVGSGYAISSILGDAKKINSGDKIRGTIEYKTIGQYNYWYGLLEDTTTGDKTNLYSSKDVGTIDPHDVQLFTVFESYQVVNIGDSKGVDEQYFIKNIKFDSFNIANYDTGAAVTPDFDLCIHKWWNDRKVKSKSKVSHLDVTEQLSPSYSITLHTTS
jgi:hypothetical protein